MRSVPTAEHQLVLQLRGLHRDISKMLAQVGEMGRMAAALGLQPADLRKCSCGLGFPGRNSLAEHRYHAHDGPEPEHWAAAEQQADEIERR